MIKVGIYHATAGHGHKKVAQAIYHNLSSRPSDHIQATLDDSLNHLPKHFRKSYPATYYFMVKHCPWLWGWSYDLLNNSIIYKIIHPMRSWINRMHGVKLIQKIAEEAPNVLISTHFLTAELFGRAKQEKLISSKLITIITDFLPHTFWIHPATDIYCVMSEEGKNDLIKRGVAPEKIQMTGIPVAQEFIAPMNRSEILEKYNFADSRLTILLTSGSFGLSSAEKLIESLENYRDQVQLYVVCGNNQEAFKALNEKLFSFPVKVFGFTDQMPELMASSDLIVAKPGGSTTSESLAVGLPMVLMNPIPGQEAGNAKLLLERDACFKINVFEDILPLLDSILKNPEILEKKKKIIETFAKPQAVNSVAEIVLKL